MAMNTIDGAPLWQIQATSMVAKKPTSTSAPISFNDLVLWLCSTALRNYLARNDKLPRKSLIAAMPVSLIP